jgi:hypothetical protein
VSTTTITAWRAQLQTYVDLITNTFYATKAALDLDQYISALTAFENINQGAASTYTDVAGGVTKRQYDDAKAAVDDAWNRLAETCESGGVVIPSTNDTIGYWRLT